MFPMPLFQEILNFDKLIDTEEFSISSYLEEVSDNQFIATKENIAINACRSIIASCMSVNGNATKEPSIREMLTWSCETLTDETCSQSGSSNGGANGDSNEGDNGGE